jgi:hypothetical protein
MELQIIANQYRYKSFNLICICMDLQISLGKLAKKHVKARAKRATE